MNTIFCSVLYNDRVVDGSIINAFEYFYTCYEIDKDVRFLIVTPYKTKDFYVDFFNKKYNIKLDCFNNLEAIEPSKLIKYKFKNILLMDYMSLTLLDNILFYKNILCLSGSKNIHKKIKKYYCEYPHITPSSVEIEKYKCKLRWDLFKKPDFLDERTFINCPLGTLGIDEIKKLNISKPIFREQLETPFNFGKYNKMIYIQNPKIIDKKPRCFIECQFLGIEYDFIFKGNYDGSYYRFYESKEESLEYRLLLKNDKLILDFLS